MSNPAGKFTGRIQNVTAPTHIDNDGLPYLAFAAVDVVPAPLQDPWVLYIDLSKRQASKDCNVVIDALIDKSFVEFTLEPVRIGRIQDIHRKPKI